MRRLSTRPLGNSLRERAPRTPPPSRGRPAWGPLASCGREARHTCGACGAAAASSGATCLSHPADPTPGRGRPSSLSAPSLRFQTRLPPPPGPREPGGGGGRGAEGAGLSLKGPPAAALRPLPGGGEDFGGCGDTRAGDGARVPRPPAASLRVPRRARLALSVRPRSPADPEPLRRQLRSAPPRSPETRAAARPWPASDWPPAPASTAATAISPRTRKRGPSQCRPVLATVTCWLDSGNPLCEDHGRDLLTQGSASNASGRNLPPLSGFCSLRGRPCLCRTPSPTTTVAGPSPKASCLGL